MDAQAERVLQECRVDGTNQLSKKIYLSLCPGPGVEYGLISLTKQHFSAGTEHRWLNGGKVSMWSYLKGSYILRHYI